MRGGWAITLPFLILDINIKTMNKKFLFILITNLLFFLSCSSPNTIDEDIIDIIKSNSSQLISFELEYKQSVFNCTIFDNEVIFYL